MDLRAGVDVTSSQVEILGEMTGYSTFTRSVPASRVAGALEIFEDMVVSPSRQSRPPKFFARTRRRRMIYLGRYVSGWG